MASGEGAVAAAVNPDGGEIRRQSCLAGLPPPPRAGLAIAPAVACLEGPSLQTDLLSRYCTLAHLRTGRIESVIRLQRIYNL